MARYIAFLKAINVGGHVVTMDRLRELFGKMGFAGAETFIASGNVIFTSRSKDAPGLERTISTQLAAALGYAVPAFVRTDAELAAIAGGVPFPAQAVRQAQLINVGFMAAPLGREALALMRGYETDLDRFESRGREFWWMSRTNQSESPFFKVRFEKVFKADVTFRRLDTVRKLVAKYPPRG
jgi:uncharacterized protein (DUF1697 family)